MVNIKSYRAALVILFACGGPWSAPLVAQTQTSATQESRGAAAARQLNETQLKAQQRTQRRTERVRQQQYAGDLTAYDAAVRRRGRRVAMQNARYLRERRAYAQAMAAWRDQVDACNAGKRKACNAPTPDPAHYF